MAVRLTIVLLCVLFFLMGMVYEPTLPIWEYLWLLANVIGGTGIAVLLGMYWQRASTTGAYVAVMVSLVLPLSDLTARWIYKEYWPDVPFPLTPQMTGFSTYLIATVLMIVVSLAGQRPTGYWDLGRDVRQLNQGENLT